MSNHRTPKGVVTPQPKLIGKVDAGHPTPERCPDASIRITNRSQYAGHLEGVWISEYIITVISILDT